ncbi:MAG: TrmH family RNA methyltransferase [Candidatus Limivicinus sp.]|jgi:TrmH family RNA methyltransferase
MKNITSRKNEYIRHLRLLAGDAAYRRQAGEYLCDGMKTLGEAVQFGAEVTSVLWKNSAQNAAGLEKAGEYIADSGLFDYASVMKNSPGPLFTVKISENQTGSPIKSAVILESVQDPGNVGTVVRTASAFGIDAVILTGDCADLYNPKTVRSTMGAIFRQRVLRCSLEEVKNLLRENSLSLYGAALSDKAEDIRAVNIKNSAVAIGSEGNGLSREFLDICDGTIIIPMSPDSESLNAAVAASVAMWEMAR